MKILGCGLLAIGIAAALMACRQTPAEQAEKTARDASTLAAAPEQARLWREAADKGLTAGLERVPVVDQPVDSRTPAAVSNQQAATRQPITIPPTTLTSIRVLTPPAPGLIGPDGFSGPAMIRAADGNRLELDLGQLGTLVLLARVGGKPTSILAGETVQVRYLVADDPLAPRQLLAIRAAAGDGIVQAVQGGMEPVTVNVPLFALVARQISKPPGAPVDVSVGDVHRTMAAGETAQVGNLTVRVVASTAYTGDSVERIEGSPYTLNLIAYRSR